MPLSKILSASLGTGVGGKVLQVVTATDSTARTTTSTSNSTPVILSFLTCFNEAKKELAFTKQSVSKNLQ